MPPAVVTCFLHNRGDVLLLRRAPGDRTYPGRWAGVSGYLEHDDPLDTALMELREETGITEASLLRRGEPLAVNDEANDRTWQVHPFRFGVSDRTIRLNEESDRSAWVPAPEIRRRETVPGLWRAYRRVSPTPDRIAADTDRGAAALSIDALECLRDTAAVAADEHRGRAPVAETATSLIEARPAMAALRNRINRVMTAADTPAAIEQAAVRALQQAVWADEAAAETAAGRLDGGRVLTLSRSGTVLDALSQGASSAVVAESRPAREGVGVAETLAGRGLEVTLCTDAAIGHVLNQESIDAVLVGADTVLPDGRVVNKTGTRLAALAAARENIPCYAVCSTDKISHLDAPHLETGDQSAIYDGEAAVDVLNPTFDVTPGELLTVLAESGPLQSEQIGEIAAAHAERSTWSMENT